MDKPKLFIIYRDGWGIPGGLLYQEVSLVEAPTEDKAKEKYLKTEFQESWEEYWQDKDSNESKSLNNMWSSHNDGLEENLIIAEIPATEWYDRFREQGIMTVEIWRRTYPREP